MNIDLSLSKYWESFNIENIEKKYNVKFVCETSIRGKNGSWRDASSLIFYTQEPHPKGSNYMAFSYEYATDQYVVSDGISVANIDISGKVAKNGDVIYSRFRHDYRFSKDKTVWIDGGRDYTRSCVGSSIILMIVDGELKISQNDISEEIETEESEDFKIEDTCIPANGTKGCLIRSVIGVDKPTYYFRVYDEEFDFIDYKITHYDIDMIIDDETAAFRRVDGRYFLDYTPDSLEE